MEEWKLDVFISIWSISSVFFGPYSVRSMQKWIQVGFIISSLWIYWLIQLRKGRCLMEQGKLRYHVWSNLCPYEVCSRSYYCLFSKIMRPFSYVLCNFIEIIIVYNIAWVPFHIPCHLRANLSFFPTVYNFTVLTHFLYF